MSSYPSTLSTSLDDDLASKQLPSDLKDEVLNGWDLIEKLDVNALTAPADVDSLLNCCLSIQGTVEQDRGIDELLWKGEDKRIELEHILRGRLLKNLPLELFEMILIFATARDWDNTTAFTISHVSVVWRVLAIGLPDMWTHISLRHSQANKIACVLERSRGKPLKVSISATRMPDTDLREVIDLLGLASPRIVWVEYSSAWINIVFNLQQKFERLTNVEYVSLRSHQFPHLQNTPKLRHLNNPQSSTSKAFTEGVSYRCLLLLKSQLQTKRDVLVLSACPNLRHASFELRSFRVLAEPVPIIQLPLLKTLGIRDGFSDVDDESPAASLLTLLDLPRLCHLTLQIRHTTDFSTFRAIHCPQLEHLRVEGSDQTDSNSDKPLSGIRIVLEQTPNLRKLTLISLALDDGLANISDGFKTEQKESDPQAYTFDFVPLLRTVVFLHCNLDSWIELKYFLSSWETNSRAYTGVPSSPLTLKSEGLLGTDHLYELHSGWSGVLDAPTRDDYADDSVIFEEM